MNIDELYECAKNLATVLSTNHMQSEASKILKVIDTEDSPYEWVPKLETIVDKISIENIPKSSKSALIDVLVNNIGTVMRLRIKLAPSTMNIAQCWSWLIISPNFLHPVVRYISFSEQGPMSNENEAVSMNAEGGNNKII